MTRPIAASVLARWRAQARRILTDPGASKSQRRLAWRFLKQWRVA